MTWWHTDDEEAWHGDFATKDEAISDGRSKYSDSFLVAESTTYDETWINEVAIEHMLEVWNEEMIELGGWESDGRAFAITDDNMPAALAELRAWAKKWCAPKWVVVDGDPVEIEGSSR